MLQQDAGARFVAMLELNGRKIHKGNYYACAKWDDANRTDMVANTAKLEEGWNRLLCKIEHGGGGYGFLTYMAWYPTLDIGVAVSVWPEGIPEATLGGRKYTGIPEHIGITPWT
jgi:hypothetical protein